MRGTFFRTTVLMVLFLCPVFIYPAVTSGADFLKIPKSARATALAESYTAMIDDPTAIDYNPAALNTLRNLAVSLMFQSWIDNTYGIYTAMGYRFHDLVIGGSFYFFNYGGLTEYDYFGSEVGTYNPYDLNIKVAASLDGGFLWDKLRGFSVGATVSYINRNLIDHSQWGLTVDLGFNYKTVLGELIKVDNPDVREYFNRLPIDAGFVVQNVGYAVDTLTPIRFSGGLAATVIPDLIVSLDVTKDVYNTPWMFKMGTEYTLFEILSLRAGFNLGRDTGNFSMGLGLRYPMQFNNLRFDYAFTPLGILGNNHNFSLYGEFFFDIRSKDYREKGKYYFYKKEYLKAREMWEKAYQLDPENGDIKDDLVAVNRLITVMELETNRVTVQSNQDMAFEGPGVVVNGTNVTFYYRIRSQKVRSVAVTGDFIGWIESGLSMAEGTNGWFLSFDLKPGLYQYKYILNGKQKIFDPSNPQIMPDGKGGLNSVFEIKEPPPPPVEETNTAETNLVTEGGSRSSETAQSSSAGEETTNITASGQSSSASSSERPVTNAVAEKLTNEVIQIPLTFTNVVRETNSMITVMTDRMNVSQTNRVMVVTAKTNVIKTTRTFYYIPRDFKVNSGKKYGSKKIKDLLINNLRRYYYYNSYGGDNYNMPMPLYGDKMFDLTPDQYSKKKAADGKKINEKKAAPKKKAVKRKQTVKKPVKKVETITNDWPQMTNVRKKISPVIETYQQ